jgi:hypothetical protein
MEQFNFEPTTSRIHPGPKEGRATMAENGTIDAWSGLLTFSIIGLV